MVFPEIVPAGTVRHLELCGRDEGYPGRIRNGSSGQRFRGQLRRRAELRQRELHTEMAVRSASNDALEHALKDAVLLPALTSCSNSISSNRLSSANTLRPVT